MTDIDIDTGAIRAHAEHVRGLVAKADQAVDAATQVSFHPETYGKIGAALVYPFLAPLEAAGVASTQGVSGSLVDTAIGLDTVAATFDFVDGAVDGAMRKIKGELG